MLIAAALLLFTLLCIALSDDRAWDNVTRSARNKLVFDGRHQEYGAFQLRREYDRRFVLALVLGIGLLATSIGLARMLAPNGMISIPRGTDEVDVDLTDVFDPPPPAPPAPSTPRPPSGGTPTPSPSTVLVIDSTRLALDTASIAPPAPDPGPVGPSGPGIIPPGPPGGSALGGGGTTFDRDTILDEVFVQERPEFPGGERSMITWVRNNVRFPETSAGSERVFVRFVVDEEGRVRDVKCVKGRDADYARAAEDVVRRMPRWKAARMNGHDVKCRLTLPISFETK